MTTVRRQRMSLRLIPAVLLLAVGALAVACGTSQQDVPIVAVEAADFSFDLPASLPGGINRFEMTNTGQEAHHMQILKLNEGVSQDQFRSVLQGVLEAMTTEGEAALFGLFQASTLAGGPATVSSGGKTGVILDLAPGQYAFICFLVSEDGLTHMAKGMVSAVEVTALPDAPLAGPEEDATVTLSDFNFAGVPVTLSAGESTLKIVNAGQEPHEMVVVRLDGVTALEVAEMLISPASDRPPGPAPFQFVGGYQAVMPGGSGWSILELEIGEYGLICLVPSPQNGFTPHFALGMVNSITVE